MNKDVELSIRQLSGAWQLMCLGIPGAHRIVNEGIETIFSGLPISFFNVAVVTQAGVSNAALRSYGHDSCAWAADKEVPWMFIVTQEALETGIDAVAVLDACGLIPVMALTGMAAQQVAPISTLPERLELRVPQDDAGCAAIIDVNSAAYGFDLSISKESMGTQSFWADQFPVLGLVDGKPVSTSSVLMVEGCRYVSLVATDPAYQRRGYADATMRRSLEMAAQKYGELPTVLHASHAGLPVYERMGYQTIATHILFMEKRFFPNPEEADGAASQG